ncbi:MAG: hypothetical protein ACLPJW_20210 [Rhodomicrobium sp.]
MENTATAQLALEAGTEFRDVRLRLDSDGAIVIEAQDMGPTVKQIWDHDDYEFSVTVPASSVARLAFELLKEKFAGNLRAVDAFRAFCEERGIEHEFFSWP